MTKRRIDAQLRGAIRAGIRDGLEPLRTLERVMQAVTRTEDCREALRAAHARYILGKSAPDNLNPFKVYAARRA